MREQNDLDLRIVALLDDPAHADHPLREALAELYEEFGEMVHQLDRITRISDRYHNATRQDTLTLNERYRKQLRQLEKLARISDRYQSMMRDLNEALKDASLRDALTGIGNRRMLMEAIKAEVARAERMGRALTVVMVDVDRFKDVNDAHGHEVGDRALIEIANAIRSCVRDYDFCGRWGGEEFLVIMPETGAGDAALAVERIRDAIAALAVMAGDTRIPLTVSCGIAEHRKGASPSETINRADAALLQAKRGGRDRCEVAE